MYYLPAQTLQHEVVWDGNPVQSFPPLYGPFLDLERVLVPAPHDFEQELQDPQGAHVQSTGNNDQIFYYLFCKSCMAFEWGIIDLLLPGQLLVLHEVDSDNDPVQSLPPWKGPFLDLERVLLPEPHVFVQSLQAAQEFQLQSTENQSKVPDKY